MLERIWNLLKKECIDVYKQFLQIIKPYLLPLKKFILIQKTNITNLKTTNKKFEEIFNKYNEKFILNKTYNEFKSAYNLHLQTTLNSMWLACKLVLKQLDTFILFMLRYTEQAATSLFFKVSGLLRNIIGVLNVKCNNLIQLITILLKNIRVFFSNHSSSIKNDYNIIITYIYSWYKTNRHLYREYNQSVRLTISLIIWYFDTEWYQWVINKCRKYINILKLKIHAKIIIFLFFSHTYKFILVVVVLYALILTLKIILTSHLYMYSILFIILTLIYSLIKLLNTTVVININKLSYYFKYNKHLYY